MESSDHKYIAIRTGNSIRKSCANNNRYKWEPVQLGKEQFFFEILELGVCRHWWLKHNKLIIAEHSSEIDKLVYELSESDFPIVLVASDQSE
jgi:hypothetical protein